jgi:hypothetical protein
MIKRLNDDFVASDGLLILSSVMGVVTFDVWSCVREETEDDLCVVVEEVVVEDVAADFEYVVNIATLFDRSNPMYFPKG